MRVSSSVRNALTACRMLTVVTRTSSTQLSRATIGLAEVPTAGNSQDGTLRDRHVAHALVHHKAHATSTG